MLDPGRPDFCLDGQELTSEVTQHIPQLHVSILFFIKEINDKQNYGIYLPDGTSALFLAKVSLGQPEEPIDRKKNINYTLLIKTLLK